MENRNNTNSVNIDMIDVTTSSRNGDVQSYLHTNGNKESSGNLMSTHMDNHHVKRIVGATSSELRHLSPNRRTTATTDVSNK